MCRYLCQTVPSCLSQTAHPWPGLYSRGCLVLYCREGLGLYSRGQLGIYCRGLWFGGPLGIYCRGHYFRGPLGLYCRGQLSLYCRGLYWRSFSNVAYLPSLGLQDGGRAATNSNFTPTVTNRTAIRWAENTSAQDAGGDSPTCRGENLCLCVCKAEYLSFHGCTTCMVWVGADPQMLVRRNKNSLSVPLDKSHG